MQMPISMNGSEDAATASSPTKICSGVAVAEVKNAPITMSGMRPTIAMRPVEKIWASTRAIPGAGSVRR